jgi:hypothetical protein
MFQILDAISENSYNKIQNREYIIENTKMKWQKLTSKQRPSPLKSNSIYLVVSAIYPPNFTHKK